MSGEFVKIHPFMEGLESSHDVVVSVFYSGDGEFGGCPVFNEKVGKSGFLICDDGE